MSKLLGIIFKKGDGFAMTSVEDLSNANAKFVQAHFKRHIEQDYKQATVSSIVGPLQLDREIMDVSSKLVASEEVAVEDVHFVLANSVCRYGCREPKNFSDASLFREYGYGYKIVVTYSCSNCTAEIKKEIHFSKGIISKLKRLFRLMDSKTLLQKHTDRFEEQKNQ